MPHVSKASPSKQVQGQSQGESANPRSPENGCYDVAGGVVEE